MSQPCACGAGCDCGCCEGTEILTPRVIANRPGLEALAYRVGTHSSFLDTMKARLSSADHPELAALTTRETSDPALALLDAWAVVGDVLTFYQERIANEGYLRTATERRSVLELARLVGYEPRPGVAASAYLAFTLDEPVEPVQPPASPVRPVSIGERQPETVIPAGSRAQSVPGPGELPQLFETSEDLTARAAWNELRVRLTRPQRPGRLTAATTWPVALYLKGIDTRLKPNDPLLVDIDYSDDFPQLYRVRTVEPDAAQDRTRVKVKPWIEQKDTGKQAVGVQSVARILEQASDLEALGISRGPTAERVLAGLRPLREVASAGVSEAELRSAIEEVLPQLREELAQARAMRATRLTPWLEGLTADLEKTLTISGSSVSRGPTVDTRAEPRTAKVGPLPGFLGALDTPLQRQPRGSLQLGREAATLFAPASAANLQLLTAGQPERKALFSIAWTNLVLPPPTLRVYALRTRASVFGHNAPFELVRGDNGVILESREWGLRRTTDPGRDQVTEEPLVVWLDAPHPEILPGSWIVLERPDSNGSIAKRVITQVTSTAERSRAEYGLSAKASRIELGKKWLALPDSNQDAGNEPDTFAVIRGTAVFAASELQELAEEPIDPVNEPVAGRVVELAELYDGLQPGRWLIVTGERTDVVARSKKKSDARVMKDSEDGLQETRVPGVPAAELVMIAGVEHRTAQEPPGEGDEGPVGLPGERIHTFLTLAVPLAYSYKRDTVTLYGNVVHATHGESRFEVMGSGDGAAALQAFPLKQPPLTYVSAPTASGIESTLEVRVNDLRWHQAPDLAGLGPGDRVYVTRTGDDGQTAVVFGNGERGARLPTGSGNVQASYRTGIGKAANLGAGRISQLVTRPLGVQGVINPLPATGGADRESRDQARRNAPLSVAALDRLVSVQDYEDFARTFAGVGKASAVRLSDGRVRLVHVTVAGEDDVPIGADSDLLRNLEAALRRFGDPRQPLRLEVRERSFLILQAAVKLLPDFLWEKVEPAIRTALLAAFGFARRDLGQDAFLAVAQQTMQSVRGVDFVDVDVFDTWTSIDPEELNELAERFAAGMPKKRLQALRARNDRKLGIRPAQLIYLTPEVPDTLILRERTS